MPATGIVLAVTGFTAASQPLTQIVPQALPGCTLLSRTDLVDASLANLGSASSQVAIANSASLIGRAFVHQMIPFDLDSYGNITAVSATNALIATIGSF